MANIVLSAQTRVKTGSGESRRIRRAGRIPAIIYGKSEKPVTIDIGAGEFLTHVKNLTRSTILTVDVNGSPYNVFVKEVQRNIVTGAVYHVDFYEIAIDVPIRAKVRIRTKGNPIGVRDGGVLELPTHEVEVECLAEDLPPRIEVDIINLKANQSIHVRDLNLGERIRVVSGSDQVVALVKFTKGESATPTETK
ncbi:MAG: 50S ribosomal protein L25 [Treponema sp.]|jgi:large subunit ribosomal protein L25|nr:50S ribosomal protein L25 [Treponema sp.]